MRLECVYARFYKSFNFDAVRKSHRGAKPLPWEMIGDAFYPYVEVPIDGSITTVVGANESGKSHLLNAIKKAVSGEGFEQRDLCRYSPFFNVERGNTTWPHLGLKWSHVTREEAAAIRSIVPQVAGEFSSFMMFREGPEILRLFIPSRGAAEPVEHVLNGEEASGFADVLPRPFDIRAGIGLPNSIPLQNLREGATAPSGPESRRGRRSLMEAGAFMLDHLPADAQQLANAAAALFPTMDNFRKGRAAAGDDLDVDAHALARDLLVKLALVDPERLADLAKAIAEGDDGHANALVSRINEQLAKHLNFPKFWAQDRDFSIRVTPREIDLVFTIQDRTGTEYTFAERSHGLKYFLSYLIQARTREPATDRSEILLMDEPDAYLSAEAQQDLLKIFDAFAFPEGDARPIQVVYVTHSPFLLDKNHAERIRVLQKGRGAEGTRVIGNASRNHYEPLRSAFGAFVGETAFIGACNLLVEGAADQILLAGASKAIRKDGVNPRGDSLDLNRMVIVPCGSASQMPYTVFLIRGRDTEKPPVVALLDSDGAGREAATALRGGERRIGRLLKPQYVLDVANAVGRDEDGREPVEIEDLIPLHLAVRAANRYFSEVAEYRGTDALHLQMADLPDRMPPGRSIFSELDEWAVRSGANIDKVGFARAVVALCDEDAASDDPDVVAYLGRMRILFQRINEQRRAAERDVAKARIATLVDRHQINFLRDHPDAATKEQASELLETIDDVLDDSLESDAVRAAMLGLRRDFSLDDDPRQAVSRYAEFRTGLAGLRHSFELQGRPDELASATGQSDRNDPEKSRVRKPSPNAGGKAKPATPGRRRGSRIGVSKPAESGGGGTEPSP